MPYLNVDDHLILYSFPQKAAFEVTGSCDHVAPAPGSDRLTAWCEFQQGASARYGYFDPDGGIIFTDQAPENRIEVQEWSFSKDGARIAFSPRQGGVTYVNRQGHTKTLPISMLGSGRDLWFQPFLQWSEDENRLLVFAHNPDHCPLKDDPVEGGLRQYEGWLVVSTETGEVVWGPNQRTDEIQEVTGMSPEITYSHCVRLSPNGEWLVLCNDEGAIQNMVLVALDESRAVIDFSITNFWDFRWVQKQGS